MNLSTIEADVEAAFASAKHAVMALLGMAEDVEKDVQTLEANSPLVRDAIVAGEAAMTARGIPVGALVAGAETVLAMAKQVDAAQTASPGATPAPAPTVPAVPAAA